MNEDMAGVYRIVSPSGSCYVGATAVSFRSRWMSHRKDLRLNRTKCLGLRNAFKKYGVDQMSFEILEVIPPENNDLIWRREMEWWLTLNANGTNLYNGQPTGTGSVIHTSETRRKQSEASKAIAIAKSMMGPNSDRLIVIDGSLAYKQDCTRCAKTFESFSRNRKICDECKEQNLALKSGTLTACLVCEDLFNSKGRSTCSVICENTLRKRSQAAVRLISSDARIALELSKLPEREVFEQWYVIELMSTRKIAKRLFELFGIETNHVRVNYWLRLYGIPIR